MSIVCDTCGKEANYKDMPEGREWHDWMSDSSRGDCAVVMVPCDDGVISVVCATCVRKFIDEIADELAIDVQVEKPAL